MGVYVYGVKHINLYNMAGLWFHNNVTDITDCRVVYNNNENTTIVDFFV